MRMLTEGSRLADRYTLTSRLGAGGMATIWLAFDKQTDAVVALKFLDPELAAKPGYGQLFHKEWRIGSRLMHAHIGRVFEYHDDDEGPFYSLQYIDGPELSVLSRAGLDDILRPIASLADALRYAHGKDVVHRDIKASNVLLDRRGSPYLIDFGVAAAAGHAGAGGGSAIAASPQQLDGEAPSAADDIYALGVLIVELICGQPPAPSGADLATVRCADGSALPSAVQSLLEATLSPVADKRPSAEEIVEQLRAAGFDKGLAARHLLGVAAVESRSEVIEAAESVKKIQPVKRDRPAAGTPAASGVASSGVSPKVLYGGLGALLLAFLVVIFLLPRAVDGPGAGGPLSDTSAPDQTESPAERDLESADTDESTVSRPESETGESAAFNENLEDLADSDPAAVKLATDDALGDLLSQLERLRQRGIERWGGQPYLDAVDVYSAGDRAYLAKDYPTALGSYRKAIAMLEPFFDRIDQIFEKTMAEASDAFENADPVEAVRLYDLAVAITPGHRGAEKGLARALNLEKVLSLMDQGLQFEVDLELDAARLAFEKVLELDPVWQPATAALARIRESIRQLSFDQRMTEGLDALAMGDLDSARAAFNAAKILYPESREPSDGLMQVDQESRLANISRLEQQALTLEQEEQWETSATVYEEILGIDSDLQFAQEGLRQSNARAALHSKLDAYISDPDSLSQQAAMQNATKMLLDLSRMDPIGPRLEDQKNELSRLLKRAATPLAVQLISDNATDVAIFKVGKLGAFSSRQMELRPGTYVAVGNRAGYRDVRLEFRVAPEIEMQPIVIQCEEPI